MAGCNGRLRFKAEFRRNGAIPNMSAAIGSNNKQTYSTIVTTSRPNSSITQKHAERIESGGERKGALRMLFSTKKKQLDGPELDTAALATSEGHVENVLSIAFLFRYWYTNCIQATKDGLFKAHSFSNLSTSANRRLSSAVQPSASIDCVITVSK